MAASPANLIKASTAVCLIAIISFCLAACRRNRTVNSNSNSPQGSSIPADPEEAKRQAESLVEKGKELYRNDQDEQAVDIFKQAIQLL